MSRQARELFILMLLLVMKVVLLVIMMILVAVVEIILLNFRKFWTDFGAGDDFLGVALVEYIDKRSIFGFETTINR